MSQLSTLIFQFTLSALVIIISGIFLVHFADKLSHLTKLGGVFIGSLFLASATSLPELSIDIISIQNHAPNLALGDLLGSSLFNLMILGIADLLHKGEVSVFSKKSASHALSGTISILVTVVALISIILSKELNFFSKLSLGEIGPGVILIFIIYILGIRLIYYNQSFSPHQKTKIENTESLKKTLSGFLACALMIAIAAPYLSNSAQDIAHMTNLTKSFLGTTLLAFSTSLPELISTMSSLKRKSYDLAIGNIFGSNAFNMILLFPLDFFHEGNLLKDVSLIHLYTGLCIVLVTSVAIITQLYQIERRKKVLEPDALFIIFLVSSSLFGLYFLKEF